MISLLTARRLSTMRCGSGLLALAFLLRCLPGSVPGAVTAKTSDKVSYNRDIRPILSDNCFFCHGPDPKKRKAKLRLDLPEEALAKNAFVPGDPEIGRAHV